VSKIVYKFLDGHQTLLLQLPNMADPISLKAAELDAVIRKLAALRTFMVPSHQFSLPSSAPVSSIPAMLGWADAPGEDEGRRLYALHPGLGWIPLHLNEAGLLALLNGENPPSDEPTSRWRH
jgi:hypothetical protein